MEEEACGNFGESHNVELNSGCIHKKYCGTTDSYQKTWVKFTCPSGVQKEGVA